MGQAGGGRLLRLSKDRELLRRLVLPVAEKFSALDHFVRSFGGPVRSLSEMDKQRSCAEVEERGRLVGEWNGTEKTDLRHSLSQATDLVSQSRDLPTVDEFRIVTWAVGIRLADVVAEEQKGSRRVDELGVGLEAAFSAPVLFVPAQPVESREEGNEDARSRDDQWEIRPRPRSSDDHSIIIVGSTAGTPGAIPTFIPTTRPNGVDVSRRTGESVPVSGLTRRRRRNERNYTIFEGTSEIQRLVIARAISGIRIP